jgi:flagellin
MIDTRTKGAALEAITRVSAAINRLSGVRSKLGAYQNRLESVVESNEINHENMTAAYSGILDTDMSEEYTNYSTYQILSQASTSVLAQANERPAQVLQLLQ